MLTRRLQVLLDHERYERLEREATRRGVAVAVLVRAAIDEVYPGGGDSRSAALQHILSAELMPVPEPAALREELDELRSRRAARLPKEMES